MVSKNPPGGDLEATRGRIAESAAVAELRERERAFESFLDACPDPCILLDGELRFLFLNEAAEKLLGIGLEEWAGKTIPRAAPGGDPEGRMEIYREVLRTGVPTSFDVAAGGRGSRGEARGYRAKVFRAGNCLGIVGKGLAERPRGGDGPAAPQEELRALAAHIVEVREEERKSLARELHDELGQSLTAIELYLRSLARIHGGDRGEAKEALGELLYLTNQSIHSVQRICSELRPAILDKLGLRAALEWLAESFSARDSLRVAAVLDFDEGVIGPKASTALFRIAQEALTNIARHAQARNASVSLRGSGGRIELLVEDDGVGIAEEEASAPDSFGLQGIRERARALGGSASVRGKPGHGTRLEVALPFPPDGMMP